MAGSADSDGFRATIGHPGLLPLYDHWRELRQDDARPPPRDAFDPRRLGRALAWLIVNEVVHGAAPDGGPRFRIRLEGDDVVQARGYGAKGRFIDEPGVLVLHNEVTAHYRRIVETGRPWYSEGRFRHAEGRYGQLYRLAVPFAGEVPDRVDFIFVGFLHTI
ncbi:hypothetical protein [Ferrovibrio sp.]|uniref:hypothetical protein n=1 Tax=Ferrovibrio sp. TaxID=1917215 RepID=UPI001B5AADF1|nr:hypothetical protein [Ferrovibrio sp.]MBP7063967.1 PAS domain-containing protein [Ferrovibrio sp.]